jgi:hypothetical protein
LWKTLFVAFVLVSCFRAWVGPAELVPRAQAQIPDAGNQRLESIRLARETNRLLAEILSTLQKGTLNVRLASTDNNGGGGGPSGRVTPRR